MMSLSIHDRKCIFLFYILLVYVVCYVLNNKRILVSQVKDE